MLGSSKAFQDKLRINNLEDYVAVVEYCDEEAVDLMEKGKAAFQWQHDSIFHEDDHEKKTTHLPW
jgi:hypothetical protein